MCATMIEALWRSMAWCNSDLPQVVGYDPPFALRQRAPAAAAPRIGLDTRLEGRVAQQVGMEQHPRIAVGAPVRRQGQLDRLARPDETQPLRVRPCVARRRGAVQQPVEIALHADGPIQARLRQIDHADQGVQRIVPRESVEPVDGHKRGSIRPYRHRIRFSTVQNYRLRECPAGHGLRFRV